jgi:hypothetical protein
VNPRVFALWALLVCLVVSGITVAVVASLEPPPQPARTPAPRALATCAAIEVVQGADTIVYEVRRKRGERCRVTLPEGARHTRATR